MRSLCLLLMFTQSFFAFSQSVKTTTDKTIDLTVFTTFRVDKGELVTLSDQQIDNENFYKNIKASIAHELTDKGYRLVEDSSAQLVISYVGEAMTKMDVENLGPLGQQPVNDPSQIDESRNWSREYGEGSLVIDVLDGATKKMVWRANSTIEITSMNDTRAINTIVYRSFRKFPSIKKKRK